MFVQSTRWFGWRVMGRPLAACRQRLLFTNQCYTVNSAHTYTGAECMSDLFSLTLNDEPYQLWQQYLALEAQGLRLQALHVLADFIKVFQLLTPEQRIPFIEQFCTQVVDKEQAFPLRYPLFSELLAPYLIERYHQQSPVAPRWIAAFTEWFNANPHFREQLGLGSLSAPRMLREARKREPDNLLVQRKLVEVIAQQLQYSTHEIPAGVLYGSNGATVAECAILLREVGEFRQLAQNTNLLQQYQAHIAEWEYYFMSYADYLPNNKHYQGFADYLRQHAHS